MLVSITKPLAELTPEQKEEMYWSTLKYDSHKWIEYEEGYFTCEFCKRIHTSCTPLDNNFKLCERNPHIHKSVEPENDCHKVFGTKDKFMGVATLPIVPSDFTGVAALPTAIPKGLSTSIFAPNGTSPTSFICPTTCEKCVCSCKWGECSRMIPTEASPSDADYYAKDFMAVIGKLPHSKLRVPYTYHHDYLRMNSRMHSQMSRSEVSSSTTGDNEELYAIALTQLLDSLGSKAIRVLTFDDLIVCQAAMDIASAAVSRYNPTDNPEKC